MAKKLFSEFIGTYVLVFFGTGAIVLNPFVNGVLGDFGIALAFGLSVFLMILVFGKISGAHINPAVSIGFYLAGRFQGKWVIPYIIAQLIGAILASSTINLFAPTGSLLGATLPSGSVLQSFELEFLMTFVLMLAILLLTSGAKERGLLTAFVVGLIIHLEAQFGGPITGASMNPARSIAPALVSGHLFHLWLYIVAPIAGAGSAVAAFILIQKLRTLLQ